MEENERPMRLRNTLLAAIISTLLFGDVDKRPELIIIVAALIISLIVHIYFTVNYIKAYWLVHELREHEELSALGFKLEQDIYVNNAIECVIIPENGWQVVFNDEVMAEMGNGAFTYSKWVNRKDEIYVKRNDK